MPHLLFYVAAYKCVEFYMEEEEGVPITGGVFAIPDGECMNTRELNERNGLATTTGRISVNLLRSLDGCRNLSPISLLCSGSRQGLRNLELRRHLGFGR